MKRTIFIFSLLAALLSEAAEAIPEDGKLLWECNFDQQLPGSSPKGWRIFGVKNPLLNARYVCNRYCVSAPNCLMYNFEEYHAASRGAENGKEMHGYFFRDISGNVTDGVFCISVAFMTFTGYAGFEVLIHDNRCILFNGRIGEEIRMSSRVHGDGCTLAPVVRHVWHKLSILMPAKNGPQNIWRARLEVQNPDGSWHIVKEHVSRNPKFRVNASLWMFRFAGRGQAKCAFDDIRIVQYPAEKLEKMKSDER